ncbi:carboxymuconolactone decarboxylase family protein [Halobaculum gomorrense]|uniref:Alkylhydroperoxidase AhpD family core domain-containing protein n=1 Tax=Halobaculum gomorrense TaxID=43928 RepID=A0A1M5RDD1_9EURY|nr:carboxymuconolactone decarboxylase family protein [Halobaculum gomorrense]SHH24281.1 alkylhydroperoxidase AhpD family core domain-containing protein [Halobaculum gomorrense]
MARVPYVDPEDLPEEYRDLVVSKLQGRPVNVYAALGNNPEVLAGTRAFLSSLWESSGLDERERELVILLASAENGCRYEWHQHVRIGREADVADDEMAAIADGDFDAFGDDEALLLRYAHAALGREVDDALHDEFVAARDDSTAVGVASLANGYTALAGVLDALDVELEGGDEFAGWDPRE